MKPGALSKWLTGTGLLLMAAALVLISLNFIRAHISGQRVDAVLAEIYKARPIMAEAMEHQKNNAVDATPHATESERMYIPDYILDPNMDMPPIRIDRQIYVGVLDIPKLALLLPIQSSYDKSKVDISPCLYQGSLYLDDMVLIGQNYNRHFGALQNLSIGDEMTFTDGVGNVFVYQVAEIEEIDGSAVDEMLAGDWDLTLFTCTVSGKTRLTVRCDRVKDEVIT